MTRSPRSRAAHSLVEVIVVSGALSALLAVTATTTAHLLRADDAPPPSPLAWGVLIDRFRQDVHASASLESAAGAPEGWLLRRPDGATVEYRPLPDQLVRRVRSKSGERNQQAFPLPAGAQLDWRAMPQRAGQLATLVVRYHRDDEQMGKPREIVLSATLGRDLRWRKLP